ncbi:MAG: lytic murein transglycosylase [Syntrophales bacterium]|nr:lytic murein transglycosylase [Syntrophales bacterium]
MTPRAKSIVSGEIPRPIRQFRCRLRLAAVFLLLLLGMVRSAAADWKPLAERLTADGYNREAVESLFSHPECLFEPDAMAGKLRALIRSRSAEGDSLAAALRKAFQRDYLKPWAIARANSYLVENKAVLEEISIQYGVPTEIVVSILLIETHLGKNTGHRRVFNRLASMARANDLETVRSYLDVNLLTPENEEFARRRCREKADWAYGELKALLNYSAMNSIDPLGIRGSIYGAIGLCQFMPSNVFLYGVDADGDGRIDPFAKPDALHSIANYLRGHGWREGMDRDDQHRIIFAYNNSTVYANTVLAVAEKIRERARRIPDARRETITRPFPPY